MKDTIFGGFLDVEPELLDYKIVTGHPADVEKTVNGLREIGWSLNGELFKMKEPGCGTSEIVVQCMALYDEIILC